MSIGASTVKPNNISRNRFIKKSSFRYRRKIGEPGENPAEASMNRVWTVNQMHVQCWDWGLIPDAVVHRKKH